jgi:hypothetical protein
MGIPPHTIPHPVFKHDNKWIKSEDEKECCMTGSVAPYGTDIMKPCGESEHED